MLKDHHWYAGGVGALFGAITLVIAAFLMAYWGQIAAALTPRPENFTELFFEDHLRLPKTLPQGETATFSFTIHNVEHQSMNYPVEISTTPESASGSATIIAEKEVILAHDESRTVPISFTLPLGESHREKIMVRLVNLDQTIHFWVQSDPPKASASAAIDLR